MDPNGVSWDASSAFTNPRIIQIQQSFEGLGVSSTINVLQ